MSRKRPIGAQREQQVVGLSRPKALQRRALEKIHLGQAFAEYDTSLSRQDVFVRTPALNAAMDHHNPHCFFVGRRGTGKTTIVRFLQDARERVISLRPEIFSPGSSNLDINLFRDMNQKPFRSLLAAFRRSLQDEAIFAEIQAKDHLNRQSRDLEKEYTEYAHLDFDIRTVIFIDEVTKALKAQNDVQWLAQVKIAKSMAKQVSGLLDKSAPWTILIDAIDDFWDGTQQAIYYLTALMHATIEINSQVSGVRVLVFLRENMFERVRVVDSEFARLETCVVGLDWTEAQLIEMVERRVNAPLNTKLELGGTTWDAFFEHGDAARGAVFGFCQGRPRDVLTYCSLALDTAQANKHERVMLEDLQSAKRRFSDSRLKDLSDEYQENYPQIGVVLSRFYGLGRRFSFGGIEDLIHRLVEDDEVIAGCKTWIFTKSTPELLIRLLYDIGFVGLHDRKGSGARGTIFRTSGPRDTTPPPVSETTDIVIHPTYS